MAHSATLLLTRPRAASIEFAEHVTDQLGAIPIVISPMLEIEFHKVESPQTDTTLIFTSRNGVEAWAHNQLPTSAPCYCVGAATGAAAQAYGFEPFVSGGTVAHLVADILKANPKKPLTHVHGAHTRGDLVGTLRASGLMVEALCAYDQHLVELSKDAQTLLQGGARVIVPLFSPRTAAQFAKAGPFGPQVDIIAISDAAAVACSNARVAPSPDAQGVLSAISLGLIA